MADGGLAARMRSWIADGPPGGGFSRRAAVARATQEWLTRALSHVAGHLVRTTGARRLAMAGGVALNCAANGVLAARLGLDAVFAFPAAGDDGIAIGAACYGHAHLLGRREPIRLAAALPFLGPPPNAVAAPALLDRQGSLEEAAQALAREEIVGWIQGRSEFGPRALGNRSILASPRDPAMRDQIGRASCRERV